MQGDITRNTFDRTKHYSRVVMQQGRVQLDADWNELNAIVGHFLRTLARDVYGSYGGPTNSGFKITVTSDGHDFEIGSGHLYVDGLLCENDGRPKEDGTEVPVTYKNQEHYPIESEPLPTGRFIAYLDVWERYVSALQDPAIREKALGGPDTAARAQILWQVRLWDTEPLPVMTGTPPALNKIKWAELALSWRSNRGLLKVKVNTDTAAYQDPCIQSPSAGYRGAENHLYRIEVHTGGTADGTATFKWSRDNGSVVAGWSGVDGNDLLVDTARGFHANQWVELLDDTCELLARPGTLVQVVTVEADRITIDPATAKGSINRSHFKRNPRVRGWDQQATEELTLAEADRAIPIEEIDTTTDPDEWLALEDGILVQFLKAPEGQDHTYRTGDYWLVAARVATGNVEWPVVQTDGKRTPKALPPHGIDHVYAPLALLDRDLLGGLSLKVDWLNPT
jgi:hypothetical protein